MIGFSGVYSACQGKIMGYVCADFPLKLFKVLFRGGAYVAIMPLFFRLDLL